MGHKPIAYTVDADTRKQNYNLIKAKFDEHDVETIFRVYLCMDNNKDKKI